MELYNINDLYIGVIETIIKPTRYNPYLTKEISQKRILSKLTKDGETFYIHVLSNTFVPAKYEKKKLIPGMSYATDIEDLKKHYSKKEIIDIDTIKQIEYNLNKKQEDTSKVFKTKNLFIGRIYSFTPNNDNWLRPKQHLSREFIFEIKNHYTKEYREIWSKVVYQELIGNPIANEKYVQVVPFSKVFKDFDTITENELLELEHRLSKTSETNYKKVMTLTPQLAHFFR